MAKHKAGRPAKEGRSVVNPEGDGSIQDEAEQPLEQWEDSEGGSGEGSPDEGSAKGNQFPVRLVMPEAPVLVYEHFSKALDAFMGQVHRKHDLSNITIVSAVIPAPIVPKTHISPWCGYPLKKGDSFSLMLNNGQIINAQ